MPAIDATTSPSLSDCAAGLTVSARAFNCRRMARFCFASNRLTAIKPTIKSAVTQDFLSERGVCQHFHLAITLWLMRKDPVGHEEFLAERKSATQAYQFFRPE